MINNIERFIEDLKSNDTMKAKLEDVTERIINEKITKEEFALFFEENFSSFFSEYGHDITFDEFTKINEELITLNDADLAQVAGGRIILPPIYQSLASISKNSAMFEKLLKEERYRELIKLFEVNYN